MRLSRLGQMLSIALVVWVVIPGTGSPVSTPGATDTNPRTTDRYRDGERLFREAYDAFSKGQRERSRTLFEKLLRRYSQHPRRKDAIYFLKRIGRPADSGGTSRRVRVLLDTTNSCRLRSSNGWTATTLSGTELPGLSNRRSLTLTARDQALIVQDADQPRIRGLRLEPVSPGSTIRFRDRAYRGIMVLRATDGRIHVVNQLPLEQYLYGVVRKELGPGWPMEAIRAQAVASRSYALWKTLRPDSRAYDLSADHTSQLYGGINAETKKITRAIESTRGEVLVHRGRVVPAFYHANSGGHTETAGNVWNGAETPYIRARGDTWSRDAKFARWKALIAPSRINQALRTLGLPPMTRPADIRVDKRLSSGRARSVQYRSSRGWMTVDASDLRRSLGLERIRSTWFTDLSTRGSHVRFTGRGWGHGVGMSQWGARRMAEGGMSYRRILRFYYPGARVASNYNRSPSRDPGTVSRSP